jgi:hypothetical protein
VPVGLVAVTGNDVVQVDFVDDCGMMDDIEPRDTVSCWVIAVPF